MTICSNSPRTGGGDARHGAVNIHNVDLFVKRDAFYSYARMTDPVINIANLTRRFGAKTALNAVSLSLPRGAVYGLVGANGAGKTTLIKHILGLLQAESGSVRVFGLDPVADPVAVLSRIGYLSEENDLPGLDARRRADSLLARVLPELGRCYAEELRQTFALDPAAKIKDLSKGQKVAGRPARRAGVPARTAGAR